MQQRLCDAAVERSGVAASASYYSRGSAICHDINEPVKIEIDAFILQLGLVRLELCSRVSYCISECTLKRFGAKLQLSETVNA